jgi:hypothetical protein
VSLVVITNQVTGPTTALITPSNGAVTLQNPK